MKARNLLASGLTALVLLASPGKELANTTLPTILAYRVPQIESEKYPNPEYNKNDNFASDTDTLLFARAIFGEGRGHLENKEYLCGVGNSIIERAQRLGKSIWNILLESRKPSGKPRVFHYSIFNPKNVNYPRIKNPLTKGDAQTSEERETNWKACYDMARNFLQGNPEKTFSDLKGATNYFVGKSPFENITQEDARRAKIPVWAYQQDRPGKATVESTTNELIPIKPLAIVPIDPEKNINAYFYSFKNF